LATATHSHTSSRNQYSTWPIPATTRKATLGQDHWVLGRDYRRSMWNITQFVGSLGGFYVAVFLCCLLQLFTRSELESVGVRVFLLPSETIFTGRIAELRLPPFN
jgi:hypothetical protein